MTALRQLSIGTKIMLGVGIPLLLLAAVAGVSWRSFGIVAESVRVAGDTNRLVKRVLSLRTSERNVVLHGDSGATAQVRSTLADIRALAADTRDQLPRAADRAVMDHVALYADAYEAAFSRYEHLEGEAGTLQAAMEAAARRAETILSGFQAEQQAQVRTLLQENAPPAAVQRQLREANAAGEIAKRLLKARRDEKSFRLRGAAARVQQVRAHLRAIAALAGDLKAESADPRTRQAAERVAAEARAYRSAFEQFAASRAEQQTIRPRLLKMARNLEERVQAARTAQEATVVANTRFARGLLLSGILVAALLVAGSTYLLRRSVVTPIQEATRAIESVAADEESRTARLPDAGADEVAVLSRAFNRMSERIRRSQADLKEKQQEAAAAADEERRAQQSLQERMTQIQGLADAVPGVIFQFYARPDGTGGWTYGNQFVSQQTRAILGIDPTPEGFFERYAAHLPESHRGAFRASVHEAVQQGAPWRFEMPFERPSGERIWVQGLAAPEEREGERVWNGVLLDITRRKQLEGHMRQAQKMETVGTLAGGIAHDFNNILHSVEAYASFGREDLPDDHVVQSYLARIESGADQAKGLVRKLLTFSRPEQDAASKPVELSALVRDTLGLAQASLPAGLEVRSELAEEAVVVADPDQMRQVVMNLVTNAGQAIGEQSNGEQSNGESGAPGVLDIRVRRVDVDADMAGACLNLSAGPHVQLSVSDTGPGMDPGVRDRIFDPFFTTKEVGTQRGMGLGLSVVHSIVQATGGEIDVQTEPGKGTTFDIYFPDARRSGSSSGGAAASGTGSPAGPAGPPGARILVVDDEASVRDLEAIRLVRLGYEAETRGTAQDALQACREAMRAGGRRPFRAVLTDYNMPGQSGLQLAQSLRSLGFEGPVVLMTGFRAQMSEDEAKEAGADAVLQKPVSSERLQQVLATLIATEVTA